MVVGLSLYLVLCGIVSKAITRDFELDSRHTAPYLETCRTNSAASLKRGRGTMVTDGRLEVLALVYQRLGTSLRVVGLFSRTSTD